MRYRVFISYRRNDQPALAQWLRQKLASELNADEVFLDMKDIEPGAPFPKRIQQAIESCLVFVALIGPQWNAPELGIGRRLDSDDDPVRREVILGLQGAESDSRRLILPVLFDGAAMPAQSDLPECLRPFTHIQALSLPRGDYSEIVQDVVERVLARLNELDATPREEKWVMDQLARDLLALRPERIAEIGREMRRRFKEVNTAPESARALARVVYGVGPPALEYLLAIGKPHEQMESLLELLATNWIKPEAAAELRNYFGDVPLGKGKKVPIECEYAAFTPMESLLKASGWEEGWEAALTVKPSEPPEEIIQQIYETLQQHFAKSFNVEKTAQEAPVSVEDRVRSERKHLLSKLEERRLEEGGLRFPFVLHVNHRMAMDDKLIRSIQAAFPPLHILVATNNAEELTTTIGGFTDVVTPSESEEDERRAYDAYASAHELIAARRRKRS